MCDSVFISGSISIKALPEAVKNSIQLIQQQNIQIRVGDADGIDFLVQKFCHSLTYSNVLVYSIYDQPRYLVNGFSTITVVVDETIKRERERQRFKDAQMTQDATYSLVVWDGKSQGSFHNILRALDLGKKIKVYLTELNDFLPKEKLNREDIELILRNNTGYSASEVVELLHKAGNEFFKNTRDFNKKLLEIQHIKKQDAVYLPGYLAPHDHFIVNEHRGKVTGIQFTLSFVNWLEDWVKHNREPVRLDLFES